MSDFDNLIKSISEGILDGADPSALTLLINGERLQCTSGRVSRSIDTCADGFSVTAPLDPNFEKYPFEPYGFEEVELYLGSELVISGHLFKPRAEFSDSGYVGTFEGASYAANIVDSKLFSPREYNFTTLGKLVDDITNRLGLEADYETGPGSYIIERATCGESESIFNFIADIALQHGVLVTSSANGNLRLVQANTKGKPVCTLGNEANPLTTISCEWNGRALHNKYKVTTTSPTTVQSNTKKRKNKTWISKTVYRSVTITDSDIPESRQTCETYDEVSIGSAEAAANHLRRRAYADSISLRIPVTTWYVPRTDQLWKENTIVTIQSKAVFLHNGYDMLIRSVEYVLSDSGTTALLDLVMPQCYSNEEIPRGVFSIEGPGSEISFLSNVNEVIG